MTDKPSTGEARQAHHRAALKRSQGPKNINIDTWSIFFLPLAAFVVFLSRLIAQRALIVVLAFSVGWCWAAAVLPDPPRIASLLGQFASVLILIFTLSLVTRLRGWPWKRARFPWTTAVAATVALIAGMWLPALTLTERQQHGPRPDMSTIVTTERGVIYKHLAARTLEALNALAPFIANIVVVLGAIYAVAVLVVVVDDALAHKRAGGAWADYPTHLEERWKDSPLASVGANFLREARKKRDAGARQRPAAES